MRSTITFAVLCIMAAFSCSSPEDSSENSLFGLATSMEKIEGRQEYLNSPYMTGGNRLYVVGHQNGTFPDLGWHVKGEMGGIWDHPIKLMDGFLANVEIDGNSTCLNDAQSFWNYPMASGQFFDLGNDISIEVIQYVPDNREGLVVSYKIENKAKQVRRIAFNFTALVDLRPVWLGERTGMNDGNDQVSFDEDLWGFAAKDRQNEWHTLFAGDRPPSAGNAGDFPCNYARKGNGVNATLSYDLQIPKRSSEEISFFIAGSYESKARAAETLNDLRANYLAYFTDKSQRYQQIEELAKVNIPDAELKTLYRWTKYANDWLIREVPEFGRGVAAGIPDYPWWFGVDQAYTMQGMLAIGEHELVRDILELMFAFSEKENGGNGRIVHEVSTNGVVFNPGTVQETPLYTVAAWEYFKWTGDMDMLQKAYSMTQRGLEWLMSQDKDGNGYPDGYGIMEIHGLDTEMIDVVVYTQAAFARAALMARVLGENAQAERYQSRANRLRAQINSDWWVDEANAYADFRAPGSKAQHLLEEAIHRADTLDKPWSKSELEDRLAQMSRQNSSAIQGYAFYHNWVVNTPMEMGIADEEKARKALQTARKYTNQYGVYVTGIDREEERATDDNSFAESKKKEEFNYVGAVMTLPTGVQAVSESRYGQANETLDYLKKLHNSFSYAAPGSMYEVSPDYGMLVQAWNIYGIAVPINKQIFGVEPLAHENSVTIAPQMPGAWENASLSDLPIGDNSISITMSRNGNEVEYQIDQKMADWEITFILPEGASETVNFNGESMVPAGGQITSDGSRIVIGFQLN